MPKFKVGDKVLRIHGGHTYSSDGMTEGQEYTVSELDEYNSIKVVGINRWWSREYFSIVETTIPIPQINHSYNIF